MGLSSEELEHHCQEILNDPRINNKIVVLCEGKIDDISGRLSPQVYKKREQMPDANFYKRCVPKSWNNKPRPQFYNCGDRKDVIDTYFNLLKLSRTQQSYLNKTKLFALVDLDVQLCEIDNYKYSDTEQIFCSIYQKTQVIPQAESQHFIWVTGLIHKEAYFISPDTQVVYDTSILTPQYNRLPVLLRDLYLKMCGEISEDVDVQQNFERVTQRINYCSQLNCSNLDELKSSWQNEFIKSADRERKRELIFLLLMIRKAKHYWQQINPPDTWTKNPERFREQLSLEIGEFYSRLDWHNPNYHIPYFFNTLYKFA